MTKTTYAQQAAAAARSGDHENAAVLYARAALEADMAGKPNSVGRKHDAKASHHERLANRDRDQRPLG